MTGKSRLVLGGIGLAVLAGGGLWLAMCSCIIDTKVTEPHRERDLHAGDVKAMLTGRDFNQKLEAGRQIDKLEPAERLQVLLVLSKDPDAAVRLFAAKKLKALDAPAAAEALGRMAKDDPDETVREMAGGR